jgi:hypothetical protein
MTGSTRKLTLIVAALVCLTLAGAAGAIIRSTIITITPGHYARLTGTALYCSSWIYLKGQRAMNCQSQAAPKEYPLKGVYDFWINKNGVTVQRSKNGRGPEAIIRSFTNP